MDSTPKKKMLLRGDINRIFDEKLRRKKKAPDEPKEKMFTRPQRRREKNAKWFDVGLGIDLPFCLIILILLTIGTIMLFSARSSSFLSVWRA